MTVTAKGRQLHEIAAEVLADGAITLNDWLFICESLWLEAALERHRGNQCAVAREAGIHRNSLSRHIQKLGEHGVKVEPWAYRKAEARTA